MPNPFPPNSAEHADYDLWSFAHNPGKGSGELDFLRGVHSAPGIQTIKQFLGRRNPGLLLRVSSIWLDKYPIVEPAASSGCATDRRELGDLAVIVRRSLPRGLDVHMWILQAKLVATNWQNHGSSWKEIELYERLPQFDLLESQNPSAKRIDTFDLTAQPPDWRFWSFLFFDDNSPGAAGSTGSGPSPIQALWTSAGTHVWSFMDGVESMVRPGRVAYDDTLIDFRIHPEWSRLYWALRRYARAKKSIRLPRGPWIRTAFELLDHPPSATSQWMWFQTLLRNREEPASHSFLTTHFAPQFDALRRTKELNRFYGQLADSAGGRGDAPPPEDQPPDDGGDGDGPSIPMLVIDVIEPEG
jgi:hypothetical protein